MKQVLIQFILIITFTSSTLYSQNCAKDNNIYKFTHDGKQYEVVKEFKSWSQAASCAVERGGYLVHINSSSENSAVYDAIVNGAKVSSNYKSVFDGGGASYVWIGATDVDAEGIWLWDGDADDVGINFWKGEGRAGSSNGKVIDGTYNNWGGSGSLPNEPDDYNNSQDAAGIALSNWPYGSQRQWNDINATNSLYYVIEYDCLGEINTDENISICFGEEIMLGGELRSESGVYRDTLQSYLDCDSIVTTDLTVIDIDTTVIISNDGKTLTANVFAEYNWLNCDTEEIIKGESDISFTPEEPGNYSVIIKLNECVDTSGCYFVCAPINSSKDTSICSGESINIDGNEISEPGTYTDVLQSFQGCDSIVSYNVSKAEFNLQIDMDINRLTSAQENVNYQWYDCQEEQIIEGETGQSFTATKSGEYSIILSNENCTDTSDCYSLTLTDIESDINTNYIDVLPPHITNGVLKVNLKNETIRKSSYSIYDINAILIKNGILKDVNNNISIQELTRGIYFLKINTGKKAIVFKLMYF